MSPFSINFLLIFCFLTQQLDYKLKNIDRNFCKRTKHMVHTTMACKRTIGGVGQQGAAHTSLPTVRYYSRRLIVLYLSLQYLPISLLVITMEWTDEKVLQLTEECKSKPCLWEPNHPNYKLHIKKNTVGNRWQMLLRLMQEK